MVPIVVEVFAAGDEVELLLNGTSLGKKPAGEQGGFYALFDAVYQPGTLEAVSYENGKVIGRFSLSTADSTAHLSAAVEAPGCQEGLIYINLTKHSASGAVVTDADEELTVGEASTLRILGFGSGNPKPLHSYTETITRTFHGRALLVVQKIDCSAPATITITSQIDSVTLSI